MAEPRAFYGSATVGTKGQIVIPAVARRAMGVTEGERVVVVRGPREGSIIVYRVDAFEKLLARAVELDQDAVG
jgi:AbrB family looped-hinge helix DNA binding protein